MARKWFLIAVSALVLVGEVLASCGLLKNRPSENPILQPTQTAHPNLAAIAGQMQQAAPSGAAVFSREQAAWTSESASQATVNLASIAPGEEAVISQPSTEMVENARVDLSKRLGIPISEIVLLEVIGQDFTADGFYCRSIKGRTLKDDPPSEISDETILLEASGRRYEYHSDLQAVIFCRKLELNTIGNKSIIPKQWICPDSLPRLVKTCGVRES